MIEVVASLSSGGEPDVDDVVGAGDEADHAGYEEHGALEPVLWLSDGEGAHAEQADADEQQHDGRAHRLPVFPHLGVVPAVHGLRGLHILVYQRVRVAGRRVFRTFVGFAAEIRRVSTQLINVKCCVIGRP